MSAAVFHDRGMGIAEVLALTLGWAACIGVAVRVAGRLGWWATLSAGVAGSTLVMHLPAVLAMTASMSSQDRHLLAVALAIPAALPAACLWLQARRRRRLGRAGATMALVGQRSEPATADEPGLLRPRAATRTCHGQVRR